MDTRSIILATVNARYSHAAFGLRWLWANMGPLRNQTVIREFVLGQPPLEIAESLLAAHPRVIGFGVYIWNVTEITQVVQAMKAVQPDLIVVVGGPEVSFEYENTPLFASADYLIRVNRQPVPKDYVLQDGDRVTMTPTKIEGAQAA